VASWKPGQSGNPTGRPKDPFRELIKKHTNDGKKLVEIALDLLDSNDDDIKFKALSWLADRGWGKAIQPVGIDSEANRIIVEFKT